MPDDAAPTGSAPAAPPRLRPTVMGPIAAKPRAPRPPVAPPPASAVAAPTAIRGTERRRIAVTAADIARLSPGVTPAVAATAVRLVEGFVVEGTRDRTITLWGHGAQADYAELISRTFDLAQAEVLGRVRAYVGRMIDLLGAIDLPAILGTAPAAGVFGRLFGGAAGRIADPCALADARVELDQLVRLTGAALDPLLTLRDAVEGQYRRIDAVGRDVAAAALAAAFLSEHLAADQPALSRRFLERSMSLSQTVLQISGNTPLRDSQADEPLRLVAAIQDVVLVTLPGWLSAVAALTAATATARRPTPTETGELQHRLQTILQQLKA